MKSLISIYITLFLILSNCTKDGFTDINSFPDNKSIQTINGTWKVISFEDFSKQVIEFQNQTNSWGKDIIITLDDTVDPHSLGGQNTSNSVYGEFEYISSRQMKVLTLGTTYVNQPDWGDKFGTAILSGNLDFIVNSKRLRIYYNNKNNSVTFEKQ